MWRIWCYALGKKEGRDKKDADKIAYVRTIIMIQLIVTNGFIIAGNIRHWNDGQCADTISGTISLTKQYK